MSDSLPVAQWPDNVYATDIGPLGIQSFKMVVTEDNQHLVSCFHRPSLLRGEGATTQQAYDNLRIKLRALQ
jgi:hypothetical protein